MQPDFATLRDRFAAFGQEHVFRFWETLSDQRRARLSAQARTLDLVTLARVYGGITAARPARAIEPVQVEPLGERELRDARARGEDALAAGRIGVLVVAGGQGTRLGFDGPKGAFPIGPVSGRTLFELHAQKLRRLRARYARPVPWVIGTSPATHAGTQRLLAANDTYGIPRKDVFLVQQQTVASLDFEGRLMLAAPDRIAESPDGHGGALPALVASGTLEELTTRGIDTLFFHQVDNPLVPLADAAFVGRHEAAGADASLRVVRKRDAAQRTGVLARIDGRLGIVEYTELPDACREARDARGELVFGAGNAAIHLLRAAFVRRVAADAGRLLPFHASPKPIACVDAAGRRLAPRAPNGYKLERFVFDAFRAAETLCVVRGCRRREYSPLKNAEGPESPATARRDLRAEYARWLQHAGIEVPPGSALEIDHSRIDGPEDARRERLANRAGEALRIAGGGDA